MELSDGTGPILALDIGGTKMAVALIRRDGTILWSDHAPTPPGGSAEEIWVVLETLVKGGLSVSAASACGVGCGGPMNRDGSLVSPLNIPGWRDFPLKARLSALTGLDTWVDNDAKALALGEGWMGDAVGCQNYLAMVVSTGVGGGLVVDGRLLDGDAGNAGHIGHVIVEPDGRPCACGGRGCLEAEASGTALLAVTGRPPAFAPPDVVARAGTLTGRAVASVANLLDLQLAIVAGSVALGFGDPFFAAAQTELSARARLPYSEKSRIVPSRLGRDGPLLGAAALALRALGVEPR